jgi:hypothetical protein
MKCQTWRCTGCGVEFSPMAWVEPLACGGCRQTRGGSAESKWEPVAGGDIVMLGELEDESEREAS